MRLSLARGANAAPLTVRDVVRGVEESPELAPWLASTTADAVLVENDETGAFFSFHVASSRVDVAVRSACAEVLGREQTRLLADLALRLAATVEGRPADADALFAAWQVANRAALARIRELGNRLPEGYPEPLRRACRLRGDPPVLPADTLSAAFEINRRRRSIAPEAHVSPLFVVTGLNVPWDLATRLTAGSLWLMADAARWVWVPHDLLPNRSPWAVPAEHAKRLLAARREACGIPGFTAFDLRDLERAREVAMQLGDDWDQRLRDPEEFPLWTAIEREVYDAAKPAPRAGSPSVVVEGARKPAPSIGAASPHARLKAVDISGKPRFQHEDCGIVAFSPDGKFAASGGGTGEIRLWKIATGRLVKKMRAIDIPEEVSLLWFSREADELVSKCLGEERAWSLDGERLKKRAGTDGPPFTPPAPGASARKGLRDSVGTDDGRHVLEGYDDGLVLHVDGTDGRVLHTLRGHTAAIAALALDANGTRALSADENKRVKLWDLTTGFLVHTMRMPEDSALALAFTPDGKRALAGSSPTAVVIFDLETGEVVR